MLSEIILVILMLAATSLCVAAIVFLYKLNLYFQNLNHHIEKISQDIPTLFKSFEKLTRSVEELSEQIKGQLVKTDWVIDQVKQRVEAIIRIEKQVSETFKQGPLGALLDNLGAMKKGLSSFFTTLAKR